MINHGFVNHQGAQPQGGGGGDDDPEDSTVPYEAMLSNCRRSLYLSCGKNTSLDCKDGKQLEGLLPKREEELNTSITGERWCGIQF